MPFGSACENNNLTCLYVNIILICAFSIAIGFIYAFLYCGTLISMGLYIKKSCDKEQKRIDNFIEI
jgi:hypothetical protein